MMRRNGRIWLHTTGGVVISNKRYGGGGVVEDDTLCFFSLVFYLIICNALYMQFGLVEWWSGRIRFGGTI